MCVLHTHTHTRHTHTYTRLRTLLAQDVGVDIFTLGQYLQPTPNHLDVQDFVTPEKFEHWRR